MKHGPGPDLWIYNTVVEIDIIVHTSYGMYLSGTPFVGPLLLQYYLFFFSDLVLQFVYHPQVTCQSIRAGVERTHRNQKK